MNRLMVIIALALLVITPTIGHAGTISWGYEDWGAANAAPIGWGTWNTTFVSNGFGQDGQSTATVTVGNLKPWGKVFYFTGVSSKAIVGSFKYLYINTYDIKGDIQVAISGPSDADFYDVTPHLVSGKTGDPLKKRVYYPGPYVFDLSGWKPLRTHANVSIQLIGEGGKGKSFTINRVFISDYNPMTQPKK